MKVESTVFKGTFTCALSEEGRRAVVEHSVRVGGVVTSKSEDPGEWARVCLSEEGREGKQELPALLGVNTQVP